jgi:hypothetical protein
MGGVSLEERSPKRTSDTEQSITRVQSRGNSDHHRPFGLELVIFVEVTARDFVEESIVCDER